jgi:hypothetical protein
MLHAEGMHLRHASASAGVYGAGNTGCAATAATAHHSGGWCSAWPDAVQRGAGSSGRTVAPVGLPTLSPIRSGGGTSRVSPGDRVLSRSTYAVHPPAVARQWVQRDVRIAARIAPSHAQGPLGSLGHSFRGAPDWGHTGLTGGRRCCGHG